MSLWLSARFDLKAIEDTLSADANNYNPDGLQGADIINITSLGGSSRNLTGLLVASNDKARFTTIFNADISNALNIRHNDASSDPDNRILTPSESTYTLNANEGVVFTRDPIALRWRLTAKKIPGGGPP